MTIGHYQRFETPGIAARDRFEYWRGWHSRAIDVPMHLDPVGRLPRDFHASAEALTPGDLDIIQYRFGSAVGT